MLSISRQHVYNLIRQGDLELVHLGRSARIRRSDVLALVGITENQGT